MVDRCLKLLKNQYYYDSAKQEQVQVRVHRIVKDDHWAKTNLQEVVNLLERDWEGLPSPPVFAAGGAQLAGAGQGVPATTRVIASLGLSNRDTEPQVPHLLPPQGWVRFLHLPSIILRLSASPLYPTS